MNPFSQLRSEAFRDRRIVWEIAGSVTLREPEGALSYLIGINGRLDNYL